MSKTHAPTRLLTAMMATGLMLATTAALAQSTRAEERRAERAAKAEDQAAERPARFPDATREEPETKPSSRSSSTRLGKLSDAYEAQDVAQTQAIADEIIADPKSNAYEKSLAGRIAGALLIGQDDAKSLQYLQGALEANGLGNEEHYEVMSIVAQLHAQEERYDEALATIDRLQTETRTQDPDIAAIRGNILLRLERYPEAIAALKPLAESPEAKPEWRQMLMAAYAESGQGAEATRLAEQIASSTPDDKRSQLNLAATYLQTEQYDKAAAVYEALRARGELTDEREYRNLMASYLSLDDGQAKAIEVINEGLEKNILKPDYQTYVALAQAHYFGEPQQIDEAIAAYQKAAPLAPNGETYLNLAKLLANEGRMAEAKQAAQQAIDKGVRAPDEAKGILARSQ
ncbi:tetratricopeptide repeat protein [Luteimonas sp. M1R5S18]|uniref:Tetratricopeptide repeat protein n=1 Tax=Luteimonas rhizosphaericola TaxID=3042024 RepID=A0ABT6JJ89_9GAMM|nr:Wzy polymerase domain-containing protein [Luteimonas rhizosphaericola]MDH5830735.1 tetratricopeptide repeat protein [Luteimonas rhizosphaericola]